MAELKLIRRIMNSFRDYLFMPHEFRCKLSEKNMSRTAYALIVTSALAFLGLIVFFVTNVRNLYQVRFHLIFLSTYLLIALLSMILLLLIRKFRIKNFVLKNMPFYIAFSLGIVDCLVSLHLQGELFTELMVLIMIFIIVSIVFTVHPLCFVAFMMLSLIRISSPIEQTFGISGFFISIIVFITIAVLAIYKWVNTKRIFIKEQNIEFYKEALKSEVDRQMGEIIDQHKKLSDMQNTAIMGLSNLVENRDSETGSHVRRTSAYVEALAKRVQQDNFYGDLLSDRYIEYLTKAAPLHDIGKIIVADNILKKKGKLTEDEFSLMKRHTVEGSRIVDEVFGRSENDEYVEIVKEIVKSHHERWDGTGYPDGLRCDEIPLSARIMAIADVFDALVSPRCYKDPFPVEDSFNIIRASSGTHFDPILVTEFQRIKDQIVDIMNEYSD